MTFGLLIFHWVEDLDLGGPRELLSFRHQLAGGPECLVISESVGQSRGIRSGLRCGCNVSTPV
jgi:hypothetical protein